MKLSTFRKAGMTHVRGGSIVRVIAEHSAPTKNYSPESNHPESQRTFKGAWEVAQKGDLAIEIVAVATGNVIGHSYLSGPALCLNNYGCSATWFDPVPLPAWRVSLDRIRDHVRRVRDPEVPVDQAIVEESIGAVMRMKYAPVSVVAFEMTVLERDEMIAAGQGISQLYGYEYVPEDPETAVSLGPSITNVVGIIKVGDGRKGPAMFLHFQPPAHATPYSMSQFQSQLVLTSPTLEQVNIFNNADWERRRVAAPAVP